VVIGTKGGHDQGTQIGNLVKNVFLGALILLKLIGMKIYFILNTVLCIRMEDKTNEKMISCNMNFIDNSLLSSMSYKSG
jgi:hypothetical protein